MFRTKYKSDELKCPEYGYSKEIWQIIKLYLKK